MADLTGKTALVTGGGNGIGKALARALAAEGAAVIVADILKENADTVAAEIAAAGGKALAVACDVCDRAAVMQMKSLANAAFGPVSLLFANAGATSFARLTDITDNEVDWMRAVNFDGVTHCLQAFLPDMITARSGHVVATASMAGLIPNWVPYHVPYTAAKAGVIGMMLNLRHELAEFGIGCTVLCPGAVTTKIIETPRYRPARFGGPQNDTIKAPDGFLQAATPEFRAPEDVAQMTLLAVKTNRPMVVTDATRRDLFMESYAGLVAAAFDDAAEFDRQRQP